MESGLINQHTSPIILATTKEKNTRNENEIATSSDKPKYEKMSISVASRVPSPNMEIGINAAIVENAIVTIS